MTRPLCNQSPTPNEGQFYPIYSEFCDFSNASDRAATASEEGDGRPAAFFPALGQNEGGFPYGWYFALGDVELSFPPSPPGIVQGEEEHGLHPPVPWECGAQAYPILMGGTVATASPMSHYVPAEDSMIGCYEPVKWLPAPLGQISPSPSQSSRYDSSPASGCGPQLSTHHGSSSLAASRAAAVGQSGFDARFRLVPDQVVSPGDGLLTPGGTTANGGLHTVTESLSSADDQSTRSPRENTNNETVTTTTTTDYNAGTLSPAATPSPKDGTGAAAPYRPQGAYLTPDQQTPPKSSGNKAPQPTTRQKKQQDRQTSQAQVQARAPPPTKKARTREAANKCRAKTKLALADLESTERAMGREHRELSLTARRLRDEVLRLKNELLAHGNCDDGLIQEYLANQARLVGGGGGVMSVHRQQQQQEGSGRP